MEENIKEISVSTKEYSKIQERAVRLANLINTQKELGIQVNSHEPIEGKMYWH